MTTAFRLKILKKSPISRGKGYKAAKLIETQNEERANQMFRTVQTIAQVTLLSVVVYSILPTYVVPTYIDGAGLVQPHHGTGISLANRTFRQPGTEEMDGDFHHHDSKGNDLIRVEKKSAVIRACSDLDPHLAAQVLGVPSPLNILHAVVHSGWLAIDNDCQYRVNDGFLRLKTGHSPPILPL